MSTIADLYPGVTARRDEPAAAARVKGKLGMAKVIAAAVRARQGGSRSGLEVRYERDVLRLDRRACNRIRDRARRSRLPHNQARGVAHRLLIDALTGQVANQIGYDVLGGGNLLSEEDIDDIRQEVRESVHVRSALEEFWPRLAPDGLLTELLASPELLASAGRGLLTPEEQSVLLRPPGDGWTARPGHGTSGNGGAASRTHAGCSTWPTARDQWT
jgi:DNA helicase IV